MDAQGIVREFNPAAERVFGYRRADAVGKELASLIIPPPLRDRHRRGLAHYLKTGEGPVLGHRIEIPGLRADGFEILVELAITAFRIEGVPVFTAYLRDITGRVRDERRRSAQYTIASLLAGSWSLKEAGPQIIETIVASGQWNCGAIWKREDAEGTLHCEITWHAGAPQLEQFAQASRAKVMPKGVGLPGRVLASKKPTWISDVTKDSNFPRATAAATAGLRGAFAFPLSAEGVVNGVIELFSPAIVEPDEDLLQMVEALGSQIGLFIHRRQIEHELQEQKESAEAANAAKDRFLATLSHELRTPLNPVLIWAGGIVNQPDLTAELRQGLQMVCRNIELEARLIDDLLDLTRITRGKLQLQSRVVDAHEVLQHAINIVRNELDERQLRLSLHLDASEHQIFADAPRLQQVFWNILRNASKHTALRGFVSVRTYNPIPQKIIFEFKDDGVGIQPQFLEKIFDAFEQVGSRRDGVGLGLAISKAIVEMHGGKIYASSDGLGKGAMFVVELNLNESLAGAETTGLVK